MPKYLTFLHVLLLSLTMHRLSFILLSVFFLSSAEVKATDPTKQTSSSRPNIFFKVEGSPYSGPWVYNGKVHEDHLLSFAENGHIPAIVDAAKRYLSGDGLEQNTGDAWYWLKRAQQNGGDISSITPNSLNQFLKDMNEDERWWLTYLAHYHDDLDLSEISIPPSFGPLTKLVPAPLSDQEIAIFIDKFKGLSRKTHGKAYNDVERELVSRTAGIRFFTNVSIDGQPRPFGMSDEEFTRRKCNFHQAVAKILPQNSELKGEHLRRKDNALVSLFPKNISSRSQKDAARYVSGVLQTGRLCPNRESMGMLEALAWAKELEKMAPDDLRTLAAEHLKTSTSTSAERYKPDQNLLTPEQKHAVFMHYKLAKTIRKFADVLKQSN